MAGYIIHLLTTVYKSTLPTASNMLVRRSNTKVQYSARNSKIAEYYQYLNTTCWMLPNTCNVCTIRMLSLHLQRVNFNELGSSNLYKYSDIFNIPNSILFTRYFLMKKEKRKTLGILLLLSISTDLYILYIRICALKWIFRWLSREFVRNWKKCKSLGNKNL